MPGISSPHLQATYIGGPTALLELGGLRLLPDPTFDPAGSEYPTPVYTLRKTQGPAIAEGWTHFSEGRPDIERAFDAAGLGDRLRWLPPGHPSAATLGS